jgi:hypothetical protein
MEMTMSRKTKKKMSEAMTASWKRRKKSSNGGAETGTVIERPDFLDYLPSRGLRAGAIARLAVEMKKLGSTECVKYEVNEFLKVFNTVEEDAQKIVSYAKTQLRIAYDVKRPKAHLDFGKGIVYFWSTKI